MGKKKKLKAIKALEKYVLPVNQQTNELHWYKGSEILDWGTISEIDGQPIDKDKMYQVSEPVLIMRNNARRLKRAFLKSGGKSIQSFLQENQKVLEANLTQS
jgi:hypothetical protein